jgi:uncharacterized membrane protein
MGLRLFTIIETLRTSYWFVPSVMALLAILLGGLTVWLDAGPLRALFEDNGWYQMARPDGAREVLSTIAGSMITVAGVVFSITIVAISFAAGQYGPRILTNFMGDRGNQVTLGTFIATFLYCLVVLRTIRGGDEGDFVPQISVMTGLVLALCSIGVLIYFIHHVPHSMHINNVVARIGEQLVRSVEKRFPMHLGEALEQADGGNATQQVARPAQIPAHHSGYIQAIADDALMDTARRHGLLIQLHQMPGDFVYAGSPVISVLSHGQVSDEVQEQFADCFSYGHMRTPAQDMFFLVDELAEIAARALSSGVNDPFTAITCLDWLGAAAADLADRDMPSPKRKDKDGDLRVIARAESFADYLDRGFGRSRQYLARDMNAAVHTLHTLGTLAARCTTTDRRAAVAREAADLVTVAQQELEGPTLETVRRTWRDLGNTFQATAQT